MQAEFYGQALHAFGRRFGETRLDVRERSMRCNDSVLARRHLHGFEGRQPVLKQA